MSKTLLTSSVPRTLETKSKLFGLELSDVLILFLNLSVENLIFGSSAFKVPMVFGTSIVLVGLMWVFKRGKPENYFAHLVQFVLWPEVFSGNAGDSQYRPFGGGN